MSTTTTQKKRRLAWVFKMFSDARPNYLEAMLKDPAIRQVLHSRIRALNAAVAEESRDG